MLAGLYWCWKNYKVKANFGISARIFVSSALASAAAFLFIIFFSLRIPFGIILAGGFLVFLGVYLVAAPLLGAVNRMDIENFRSMFSSLGVVSKVLNIPLLLMHKVCGIKPENNALPDVEKVL
jgi:hypothetical protein